MKWVTTSWTYSTSSEAKGTRKCSEIFFYYMSFGRGKYHYTYIVHVDNYTSLEIYFLPSSASMNFLLMSKKSWSTLYSKLPSKLGQDFLDRRYRNLRFSISVPFVSNFESCVQYYCSSWKSNHESKLGPKVLLCFPGEAPLPSFQGHKGRPLAPPPLESTPELRLHLKSSCSIQITHFGMQYC